MDTKNVTLNQFEKWFNGLADHDRMNFSCLLNLPTALEVISQMPKGEYRDMATFALRRKSILQEETSETGRVAGAILATMEYLLAEVARDITNVRDFGPRASLNVEGWRADEVINHYKTALEDMKDA